MTQGKMVEAIEAHTKVIGELREEMRGSFATTARERGELRRSIAALQQSGYHAEGVVKMIEGLTERVEALEGTRAEPKEYAEPAENEKGRYICNACGKDWGDGREEIAELLWIPDYTQHVCIMQKDGCGEFAVTWHPDTAKGDEPIDLDRVCPICHRPGVPQKTDDPSLLRCPNCSCRADAVLFRERWYHRPTDEPIEPIESQLEDVIRETLKNYQCQYTTDDDGDSLGLIDVLSPMDTVEEGRAELELLIDELAAEIAAWNRRASDDEIDRLKTDLATARERIARYEEMERRVKASDFEPDKTEWILAAFKEDEK